MDEDWDDEQLAALDAAEAAVSSSSSSSRNDNDIASPQDIRDALQRAQSALATMRARNHAGASGRWCRCDTARLHFFHKKALTLIQRGQLDEMSEHWPMLEGPKDVTGEAKVCFDEWAANHYTRPRDGAAAVTEDPTELKRLLDSALEMAHAHALPQIPHGRPPSERSEYKITMNFGSGRYMGKTLEEAGRMDYEGAGFLRWVAGYGTRARSCGIIQEREDACSAREREGNIILREAEKHLKSENFRERELRSAEKI